MSELPARSITSGGPGGIALLGDLLVTRGSPLARHAEVRRFSWGGAGAWVSSCHPSWDRDDQLGLLSGIDLAGKPAALQDWDSRGWAGISFPRSQGFAAHPPALVFPLPLLSGVLFPHRWRLEGCRMQAGMEGFSSPLTALQQTVIFPAEFRITLSQPGCAALGGRETSLY